MSKEKQLKNKQWINIWIKLKVKLHFFRSNAVVLSSSSSLGKKTHPPQYFSEAHGPPDLVLPYIFYKFYVERYRVFYFSRNHKTEVEKGKKT